MLVADTYVGNVDEDPDLDARLEGKNLLTLTVDETERRRSRFRSTTEDGSELGVVVGRELQSGDVLSADGTLVRVALDPVDAMVVDLGTVDPDRSALAMALELGHAVGNRHWDLAVEGDRGYLPVADSRERMEAAVEPALPEGATVGYEEVTPELFDESDGGPAQTHGGGHDHGAEHDHTHDDTHWHPHESGGHAVRELDPEGSS